MRLAVACIGFILLSYFSGIPQLLSGLLDAHNSYSLVQDSSDDVNKDDSKEKEEKEKEDAKESFSSPFAFIYYHNTGRALETLPFTLRESGYYPEDHCPPPEFI